MFYTDSEWNSCKQNQFKNIAELSEREQYVWCRWGVDRYFFSNFLLWLDLYEDVMPWQPLTSQKWCIGLHSNCFTIHICRSFYTSCVVHYDLFHYVLHLKIHKYIVFNIGPMYRVTTSVMWATKGKLLYSLVSYRVESQSEHLERLQELTEIAELLRLGWLV
jgi:hypothetical protein